MNMPGQVEWSELQFRGGKMGRLDKGSKSLAFGTSRNMLVDPNTFCEDFL